ncbi:unnamed protein product [Bathycoccus prasinos]
MSQNHSQHLLSNNPKTLRRYRRVAKLAVFCFLALLASCCLILLKEFQSDSNEVQMQPMRKHPHAHDGSLLDRLEDAEEVLYRKLDPYLHHGEGEDALVLESLRKPIDLPHFHWQRTTSQQRRQPKTQTR